MNFRFLVNDLNENKTVTIRVEADREAMARQKLEEAGYRPIAMIGVEVAKGRPQARIRLHLRGPVPSNKLSHTPSRTFRLRVKLSSLIADYLAPFNLLG